MSALRRAADVSELIRATDQLQNNEGRSLSNVNGRPPNKEKYGALMAATHAELAKLAPYIPLAMKDLIVGVTVAEFNADGDERIYTKPPNTKAIEIWFDRMFGKAAQVVEHTGAISVATLDMDFTDDEQVEILELALAAKKRRLENTVNGEVINATDG